MTPPNVSRETQEKLAAFVELLLLWNKSINLISKTSSSDIWNRHIVDSIQLFDLAPKSGHWLDLGSGGGLPGLVIAILAQDRDLRITMVESDQRKCAFLRQAARNLQVTPTILCARIEDLEPQQADVVSARALDNLSALLGYLKTHGTLTAQGVFPKGKTWASEVKKAQERWQFSYDALRSKTQADARILHVTGVENV